jgi:hypothetical protein
VIAEHEEISGPTEEPLDPTTTGNAYRILKCAGCDTVYFQREALQVLEDNFDDDTSPTPDFTELKLWVAHCKERDPDRVLRDEISYWPEPRSPGRRLDWRKLTDGALIDLLNSVYTALEHDLRVLGAIGMRVVFDRASELIGVDPSQSFGKKLDQLQKDGHIGATQRESLEVLTDAGGAAAHRGWAPDQEQLNILTSIMEHFVSNFILQQEAGRLKEIIPPRQRQRAREEREQSAQLIELRPPKP